MESFWIVHDSGVGVQCVGTILKTTDRTLDLTKRQDHATYRQI